MLITFSSLFTKYAGWTDETRNLCPHLKKLVKLANTQSVLLNIFFFRFLRHKVSFALFLYKYILVKDTPGRIRETKIADYI